MKNDDNGFDPDEAIGRAAEAAIAFDDAQTGRRHKQFVEAEGAMSTVRDEKVNREATEDEA